MTRLSIRHTSAVVIGLLLSSIALGANFKLALKVAKLDVPSDATAALAGFNVKANALAQASFTFTYGR